MQKAAGKTNKKALLEQIKTDILKQNVCPDLAQEATNLVMGVGNADAEIVFIGEAPGKNEDLQGEPFVGAAGKFLDEMLASVGLERDDVYITNIVKYRPPNNRDPLPDEKKAFWPFLLKEINTIKPKIIATLGRHSMEYFLPNMRISQIHGQPKRIRMKMSGPGSHGGDAVQGSDEQRTESYQEYGEGVAESITQQRASSNLSVTSFARKQEITSVVILPLFHPAAALYNGSMRETLISDFQTVPQIIKQIKEENK